MGTGRKLIAALCLIIAARSALAADYHTLYGFKIGQSIESVKEALGEPSKVIPFEDGWIAYAYRKEGHNVIFETNSSRPDLIISIQIEGSRNPEGLGLDHVNLGSSVGTAKKMLGEPTVHESALDSATDKPINNAYINRYGEALSFEESADKVTSIKINYASSTTQEKFEGLSPLLGAIKSNDYYTLCELLSENLTVNDEPVIHGQMLESIRGKSKLNEFLFSKSGLAGLGSDEKYETNIRVSENGSGFVLKFKNRSFEELYFVQTFQGWVLESVW